METIRNNHWPSGGPLEAPMRPSNSRFRSSRIRHASDGRARVVGIAAGIAASALVLLAAAPVTAQTAVDPQAYAILQQAQQKFWDRLVGVENYTLIQECHLHPSVA